jgi:AraC-like DNA-binding protein
VDNRLLDETLRTFGMTGVFYAVSDLAAPWGIAMPPMPGTMIFHLLTSGEAVVEVDGAWDAVRPGDLVLVPHGTGHAILDQPGSAATPLFDLPRVEQTDRYERVHLPGDGPRTELICGAVSFTGLGAGRLVRSLPPVLRLGHDDDAGWQRAALDLIGAESRHPRPGSDVVTARLADVLVVQAVRGWLESAAPDRGWVAGLRDPVLGRALSAFHADPVRPWSLESLARTAGLSRSAFAARFSDLMGETPIGYVTAWRMDLAARLVREGSLSQSRIAERVGYRSEAAFNRAFRRAHGLTPGAFARRGSSFSETVSVPAPA